MNDTDAEIITTLSLKILQGKIDALNERERELMRRGHELWKSGGAGSGSGAKPPEHVMQLHDRARQLLDEAGALLPPIAAPSKDDELIIQAELAATKLALAVLNKARIERQGIEAAARAVEQTPAWREKVRKLVLALPALVAAIDDCGMFLESLDRDCADQLPLGNLFWTVRLAIARNDLALPRDMIEEAASQGVFKISEVKGVIKNER